MSSGRWQPPHQDPAKVQDTPVSKARKRAACRPDLPRCAWRGCEDYTSPYYKVELCSWHAKQVYDVVVEHHGESQRQYEGRLAAEAAERAEIVSETTQKIEAGIRIGSRDIVPGWVYYIQIDDAIKIGYAANVARRMRAYPPTAKLLAVEPGTKIIEKRRHQHFGAYLAHGREWFRDVPELRGWIATLVTEYGEPTDKAYRYTTPTDGPSKAPVVAGKRSNRRW